MEILRPIIHYVLHFVFPVVLAWLFFRSEWKKAYFIMLLTMLVDVDHLFATPIFDPNRASIGFHFLHSYYAIGIYFLLLFFKGKLRIVSVGLLFHMLTDYIDMWLNPNL
ncbi:hypothetical protein G6R40_09460 [Chryseobacterium sp. POL2]|uniref:DUF6122 family protein n=1 Tax=Chryseobacterium sp. POL2 TaxID=2713414 RepID=UPI0013E18977|nr:DUF6122 family protein [Chryseobacterium sp. POL2]QIG89877.1 hypothetical protein G6R40_09460 [Chryseobacterium sp. POL2]